MINVIKERAPSVLPEAQVDGKESVEEERQNKEQAAPELIKLATWHSVQRLPQDLKWITIHHPIFYRIYRI